MNEDQALDPIKVLIWQWGRRGAGPRVAVEMASALNTLPGCDAMLSLSTEAEILGQLRTTSVDLPVVTYRSIAGYVWRLLMAPVRALRLLARIERLAPDVAICAMPGPLDLEMALVLRRLSVPFLVVVHDADRHPGDASMVQMLLQRRLITQADGLVALTRHVADRLVEQRVLRERPLLMASLPPFVFGPVPPAPLAHGGRLRLLCFGRLLAYKGLDLLAEALASAALRDCMDVRVVGQGPQSQELSQLEALDGVTVENRWVPEDEVASLIAWADAVILPYREASQSGVAAAAIAARRWVVATRVGGLVEQFRGERLAIMCAPDAQDLSLALMTLLTDPPEASPVQADPHQAWHVVAARLVEGIRSQILRQTSERLPLQRNVSEALDEVAAR